MSITLPPELWRLVSEHFERDQPSCAKCSRVCRSWQAIFEPLLYSRVRVRSEDFDIRRGTMSLRKLESLTSGPASWRALIRELQYTVLLPYQFDDYQCVKLQDAYDEQNQVRQTNHEAFRAGIASLFQIMASWGQGPLIVLEMQALGRAKALEPGTVEAQGHGNFRLDEWQGGFEGETVIDCVARLNFYNYEPEDHPIDGPHFIWGGSALQIAAQCK
ncbi:hypothetical protein BJY00DRAFT_320109 [Aspergillus carlsbadensis]|nr:hypothetical protein BJY00DRAFT_320109 [Aspergillus carlsbadensis]